MEIASIRMAETPDARKDAEDDDRPACSNRIGAYWHLPFSGKLVVRKARDSRRVHHLYH